MEPRRRIYLDHAATTPVREEVAEAMRPFLSERAGNASSLHAEGRAAREALEAARQAICSALRAEDFDLVFTSGGTEADNTALAGTVLAQEAGGFPRILASAVEHPALLGAGALVERLGGKLEVLDVDRHGRLEPGTLERALLRPALLVSVMAANNETGTLQPIELLGDIARRRGALFHSDAVQLLGKRPLRLDELPLDLATISAHKVHGPKGIGALLVRRGVRLAPLLRGGSQEDGRRGGTEPVALAAGFARAVELAEAEREREAARLAELRERLRERLAARIPGAVFNTPEREALPSILNLSFPRIEGESLVLALDRLGIAASTGSACNTGSRKPSHVLRAMGRSEREVRGSLRLSLGRGNQAGEIDEVVERLAEAVARLERLAPR
jgi:cysteine desulfurase